MHEKLDHYQNDYIRAVRNRQGKKPVITVSNLLDIVPALNGADPRGFSKWVEKPCMIQILNGFGFALATTFLHTHSSPWVSKNAAIVANVETFRSNDWFEGVRIVSAPRGL